MIELPLTKGYVTLIDDEDFERVSKHRWNIDLKYNRAKTGFGGKWVKLHRFILGITDPNVYVDHIDGNSLNNQKSNLRIASKQQNSWNRKGTSNTSSIYCGVFYNKQISKWQAGLILNGKRKHLGTFECEHSAAIAYNDAAKKLRGEFARMNNIPEGIEIRGKAKRSKARYNTSFASKIH